MGTDRNDSFKFLQSKGTPKMDRKYAQQAYEVIDEIKKDPDKNQKFDINEIYQDAIDEGRSPFIRHLTPISQIDEKEMPSPRTK